MKFKVGDKVRVRSWDSMEKEFGLNWRGDINCPVLFLKGMKEYCGTIQTITAISQRQSAYYIGNTNYYFDRRAVEPVKQETKGEHFRKEIKKIRNEHPDYDYIAVVNDKPVPCRNARCKSCLFCKTYGDSPVLGVCTIIEGFKKWCAEPYKEPEEQPKQAKKSILDKVEHDYLAAIIAPKKIYDKVIDIKKCICIEDSYYYFIYIHIFGDCICLSKFSKADHMYDGMETDRPYTLEELGLKKEAALEGDYLVKDSFGISL